MFKTLRSKLIVVIVSLTAVMLILLGGIASLIFRAHYIAEIKAELTAETNAVNRIIMGEYLDSERYPIAREKLFAISRQYGAAIKLVFVNNSPMNSDIVDSEYAERWKGVAEFDCSEFIDETLKITSMYNYRFDLMHDVLGIKTLTVTRLIISADGSRQGIIMLHYDMSAIYETLRELYLDIFLSVAVALLIAMPIALIISRRITNPIISINNSVTAFSRGDYEIRTEVIGHDEVAELAKSFNNMADEIAGTEKQRREFVANVSHELRSPLTSLHGFIEAMQDGIIPLNEYGKYLPVLLDETDRMGKLVNDLLDISRIESGQTVLEFIEFNINELIGNTLFTFETRINEKNPDISIELGDGGNYVYADPNRIGQVLRNLIDNAIRYIPDSNGKLKITARTDKQFVIISVANNGEPIPKEALPHIFDRFYKVERARTRGKHSGTGLGLSIAKLIIHEHGGDISVISDENKTEFSFSVKRAGGKRGLN